MAASSGKQLRSLISLAFAFGLLFPIIIQPVRQAFADGLFMEEFQASLRGRDVRLAVNVNPPILTSANRQDAYIQFSLYDAKTNATIKYSTWDILIEKGIGGDANRLMRDVFHTESGLLKLKIQPQDTDRVTVLGTQEDFLNAWVADPGGTINLRGPIFLEGGLYHFGIRILGIDNIRSLFNDTEIQSFDSWLSVGDVFDQSVSYNGNSYNTTIISYYDRINEFDFADQNKTFTWSMPFDWDVDRINKTTIFVHEEFRVPKSMEGIGDSLAFRASVNDNRLPSSKLALDPYTLESDLIVHFLLYKPDILALASKMPPGENKMRFTLSPSSGIENETTTEIATDTGGINVALEWTPSPLDADKQSTVKVTFSDAFSGTGFGSRDVLYDLTILDTDGQTVYTKQDITANDGTDTQTIDFPSNKNYRVQIQVEGLMTDGQTLDKTRAGIARGLVVVPEFPPIALLLSAVAVASVALSRRLLSSR